MIQLRRVTRLGYIALTRAAICCSDPPPHAHTLAGWSGKPELSHAERVFRPAFNPDRERPMRRIKTNVSFGIELGDSGVVARTAGTGASSPSALVAANEQRPRDLAGRRRRLNIR